MRNAFARAMTELAEERDDVCLLSGDIGNRMFDRFKEVAPTRFLNCGIAEGNMMSMAAGMGLGGLRPVVYTITPFNTTRCLEQIRTGVAYHEAPVVIVGTGSGLSYAELGATHHSLEDLAKASDYISLHAPSNEHTNGMISTQILSQMRPDACILNFARGELVDEAALAHHFDNGGSGRYVCDFAVGPELSPRSNVIVLPHLGASTDEAEENAAAMAADTTALYLQTGTIRDSVNFPTTTLPARLDTVQRVCVVNENRPGMLGEILSVFGNAGINIVQQINTSKGDVGYNVIDIERLSTFDDVHFKSWDALQFLLTSLDGVKSTRYIYGTPASAKHAGYAVNFKGQVYGIGSVGGGPTLPSFGELLDEA